MREGLAMAGLGVGLFVAATAGTLAFQGRLNGKGLQSLPVVSWFSADEAGTAASQDDQANPATQRQTPKPSNVEKHEKTLDPGGLYSFPKLDSGMSSEDIERILQQANAEKSAAEQERAQVAAERQALDVIRSDVEDREAAIAQRMLEVDRERERLDTRIAEFERQVLLVERDEIRGLRDYGRSLAAFEPARAAAIVQQEWGSEAGRKRIARVLALMDPAESDAVLGALPDDRLREVLLERMKVLIEPKDR